MRKFDLEERLISFAVKITELAEQLPSTFTGKHLGNQIIRSGTSPALNYGEAQAAESRADFVHKMKIVLKELRETGVILKIFQKRNFFSDEVIGPLIKENHELTSIFVSSLKTATANLEKEKKENRKR